MIKIIDQINLKAGQAVSWLVFLLVLLIVVDVMLRYVFNYGSVANAELEWHLFGVIIMLSAGYAYQKDRHVRVDVFYHRMSPRARLWTDMIGNLVLLLPFCLAVVYKSVPFALNAYHINETSPDPGGLPARYIIKFAIPVAFMLLGLQGVSKIIGDVQRLLKHG